jgi:hypothetical protein
MSDERLGDAMILGWKLAQHVYDLDEVHWTKLYEPLRDIAEGKLTMHHNPDEIAQYESEEGLPAPDDVADYLRDVLPERMKQERELAQLILGQITPPDR